MLKEDMKVSEAPQRNEFEHLPPGDYVINLTNAVQSSKHGEELIITLENEVQEGEYAGRKIFDRLNFGADAQWKIDNCYAAIAEIAVAVGESTAKKDLSNLMNKRLVARATVSKPNANGKVFNNVKEYLPYKSSGTVTNSQSKTVPTDTAKTESSSTPPWKRKQS